MSFGKWLTNMIVGEPQAQPVPVRAMTQAQLMAQRQLLATRTLTPERQERIAQAFEAQSARLKIEQGFRDAPGRQNLTDAVRRMMDNK
jgi:hypothetical protein